MSQAFGLAALMLVPAMPAPSIATGPDIWVDVVSDALDRVIASAADAADRGETASALRKVMPYLVSPEFSGYGATRRFSLWVIGGASALAEGDTAHAKEWLTAATAFDQASEQVWRWRTDAALFTEDWALAADGFTRIVQHWPESVASLNTYALSATVNALDRADQGALAVTLLDALFAAQWAPDDMSVDGYRVRLSWELAARGAQDRALQVARRIDDPHSVLAMRVDRRFDALRALDPGLGDIQAAIRRNAADLSVRIAAAPDRLALLQRRMDALREQGRFAAAWAQGEVLLASASDAERAARYQDFDDQFPWLLDVRAQVLAALGRWDEALSVYAAAARRLEQGGLNVSQAINRASLLNRLGRPREARAALADLGPMSPFGHMQAQMVRLESAMQQRDAQAQREAMAYLRKHQDDAIDVWQDALMLTNDMQGAAAVLMARLADPQRRSAALLTLQDYLPTPMTRRDKHRHRLWTRLLARPDVHAAIDRVGRIESVGLVR